MKTLPACHALPSAAPLSLHSKDFWPLGPCSHPQDTAKKLQVLSISQGRPRGHGKGEETGKVERSELGAPAK